MNIKGELVEVFDTVQINETFQKREFILEYIENPQYPELIKFELTQDRCDIIDQYKVGEMVDVWFNIRGRKWTDPQGVVKYFNSLQAWRIQPPSDTSENDSDTGTESEWSESEEQDDLPF